MQAKTGIAMAKKHTLRLELNVVTSTYYTRTLQKLTVQKNCKSLPRAQRKQENVLLHSKMRYRREQSIQGMKMTPETKTKKHRKWCDARKRCNATVCIKPRR